MTIIELSCISFTLVLWIFMFGVYMYDIYVRVCGTPNFGI